MSRSNAAACPLCSKPAAADYRPFCSKRCADVDLHNWLGERYVVPGTQPAGPNDLPTDDES